jgi:hypothetical protein
MKIITILALLLCASLAHAESVFIVYWGGGDSSATISMQSKTFVTTENEMKTLFENLNIPAEDVAGRVLMKEFRNAEGDIAIMCRLTKLIQHYNCSIDVIANDKGKISKAEGYISYVAEGLQAEELNKAFYKAGRPTFTLFSTDNQGKQIQLLSTPGRFALKYTETK